MEKSILVELIQVLTRSECSALGKYLRSPYHNTRTDVTVLFDYLTAKDGLSEGALNRARLFSAIYPDQTYNNKQLNYVISYLIKLLESFLAQESYAANEQEQLLHLVYSFRQRKMGQLTERATRAAEKKLGSQPLRSAAFFRNRFQLDNEILRGQLQQGRGRDVDLDRLNEAHEKAFIIEKLQLGCMTQSRQTVTNKVFEVGFLPVLLHFLKDHIWLEEPAIAAWYHGYFIQTDPDATGHFEQLKAQIFGFGTMLSEPERHDLFLLAVNFCIRRINLGDAVFSQDLFDLYREGLTQDVFLENGAISRWSYNNITNAALKTGDIKWALHFVETYRPKLEPAFRDTSYFFNLARCLYEKGAFNDALTALNRIEYDDVLQNLSAKTLQIKIYYHTGAWQVLDSLLDSVRIYIRRKKVLGYHKENYTNIVRLTQRLIALVPGDRAERAALRQEVEQCKVLGEKAWLLKCLS